MKGFTFLLALLTAAFVVSCGGGEPRTEPAGISEPRPAEQESPEPAEPESSFQATRGIEPVRVDWDTFKKVSASVSEDLYRAAFGTGWLLSIPFSKGDAPPDRTNSGSASGNRAARGTIRFRSEAGEETVIHIILAPIEQTLHFTRGALGFLPAEMDFEISGPETAPGRIGGIFLEPGALDYEGPRSNIIPIPADPGVILQYDPAAWRQRDYELFRWNLIPEVLIFEFRDYAVQRRYFTRLAFFVGVTGESGRIEEESYYEGRHVFNAHDYRPEDIAAFYLLAEERGISLNPEEQLLREIALENGVLRFENGILSAGEGAILSIAAETPSYLRKRLLTHEAMHGLYYAVPEFREGNFRIFEEMEPFEKQFWTIFLANKGRLDNRTGYDGYDVENEYLLVNEILGHMMQLLPREVNSYFLDIYLTRMEQRFPGEKELFAYIRRDAPDMFLKTRKALEDLMHDTLGFLGGNIYMTEKKSSR